jgi:hypothetical protein
MFSFPKLFSIFLPAMLILAACGGGDDDESSGDGDDDDGGDTTSSVNRGDKKGSNDSKIPTLKDGGFGGGSVHIEYSGGKDFKGDFEGNGIAQGGFTLLTFVSDHGSVLISFQPDSKDEPGGLAITTKDISTAGEWGVDCSITAEEEGNKLEGEFECDEIEAIEPGGVKSHKVRVKGNFSVSR